MYYKAKISYLKQLENGSITKKSETYLIDAVSHTEAEARLQIVMESYISEYELVSLNKTKLTDVVFDSESNYWYQAGVEYVSYDEESGKEKRIKELFYVSADSIQQVIDKIKARMEGSIVDWGLTKVLLTDILDVFTYDDGQVITDTESVETESTIE